MIAYDLKSTITSTFAAPASMIGNSALENGYIGMLAGVPVYETSNIANTGTAGDYNGAVFHRDALGLALQADINIETQRQAALRGWDIVGSARYGVGVLNNPAAQYLAFDSSIQGKSKVVSLQTREEGSQGPFLLTKNCGIKTTKYHLTF